MELKKYLHVLIKKWWIVIPTFLITFSWGMVSTYTATPIYSAAASYIVVPSSSFSDVGAFASGLDILGRREAIATTFTEIASSRNLKRLAVDSLDGVSGRDYSVGAELRAGTNIIEVVVKGPDPVVARDLANAIGSATEEYVRGLYEVFILLPLDEATVPRKPTSPNISLNLILSAILGLVLGGGLAALSEYLETPLHPSISVNIIDEKTGVYNTDYLLHRLGEEMIRAKRNRYPLALALIRFGNLDLLKGHDSTKVRTELLFQAATVINQSLREEDIVAPFEKDTFAILLPDMTGRNAQATMEYIQTLIARTPFQLPNNNRFNLKGTVGVVTYSHNGSSLDELVTKATQALQLAEVDQNGKTHLIIERESDNDTSENSPL